MDKLALQFENELKGAAIQTLSRQTGIDKEQLTEYKNKAKKVCGK